MPMLPAPPSCLTTCSFPCPCRSQEETKHNVSQREEASGGGSPITLEDKKLAADAIHKATLDLYVSQRLVPRADSTVEEYIKYAADAVGLGEEDARKHYNEYFDLQDACLAKNLEGKRVREEDLELRPKSKRVAEDKPKFKMTKEQWSFLLDLQNSGEHNMASPDIVDILNKKFPECQALEVHTEYCCNYKEFTDMWGSKGDKDSKDKDDEDDEDDEDEEWDTESEDMSTWTEEERAAYEKVCVKLIGGIKVNNKKN
jgi:hypothetical protein